MKRLALVFVLLLTGCAEHNFAPGSPLANMFGYHQPPDLVQEISLPCRRGSSDFNGYATCVQMRAHSMPSCGSDPTSCQYLDRNLGMAVNALQRQQMTPHKAVAFVERALSNMTRVEDPAITAARAAEIERSNRAFSQSMMGLSNSLLNPPQPKPVLTAPAPQQNISCMSQRVGGYVHTNCR